MAVQPHVGLAFVDKIHPRLKEDASVNALKVCVK
jgi:hypothetical protein